MARLGAGRQRTLSGPGAGTASRAPRARPAARAASNSAVGVRRSGVPCGPRASASQPMTSLPEVDDRLEAHLDRALGQDVGERVAQRASPSRWRSGPPPAAGGPRGVLQAIDRARAGIRPVGLGGSRSAMLPAHEPRPDRRPRPRPPRGPQPPREAQRVQRRPRARPARGPRRRRRRRRRALRRPSRGGARCSPRAWTSPASPRWPPTRLDCVHFAVRSWIPGTSGGDDQADGRPDPRRLHRRGDGARAGLRPARDGGRRDDRHAGDARRPDPRRRRLLAAARDRRPGPREGAGDGRAS